MSIAFFGAALAAAMVSVVVVTTLSLMVVGRAFAERSLHPRPPAPSAVAQAPPTQHSLPPAQHMPTWCWRRHPHEACRLPCLVWPRGSIYRRTAQSHRAHGSRIRQQLTCDANTGGAQRHQRAHRPRPRQQHPRRARYHRRVSTKHRWPWVLPAAAWPEGRSPQRPA